MFDAVVLAGGSGRRLGGADKPGLLLADRSLLDRVLSASAAAGTTVVVGPPRATCRPVQWCREEPAGSGPVAALRTGLARVTAEVVVVLAADLPFLTPDLVRTLLGAMAGDGAVLVDAAGRDQYLCSAWSTAALRAADLTVDRMGAVVRQLDAARVSPPVASGRPAPWTDIDTAEDLSGAQQWEKERG
ncbi:MAG: molybdopterin-guanine dinucleotide biosynthesis protein MobA [Frankiales bacterium]|nr:molybdopterin-guanine dinucleotide biosynthesis protein MobA [Frankiales bacterium]